MTYWGPYVTELDRVMEVRGHCTGTLSRSQFADLVRNECGNPTDKLFHSMECEDFARQALSLLKNDASHSSR